MTGWPMSTMVRGKFCGARRKLAGAKSDGEYVPRDNPPYPPPAGRLVTEFSHAGEAASMIPKSGTGAGKDHAQKRDALGPRSRCPDLWRRHGRHERRLGCFARGTPTFSCARRPSGRRYDIHLGWHGLDTPLAIRRNAMACRTRSTTHGVSGSRDRPARGRCARSIPQAGPAALDYLEQRSEVKFTAPWPRHPDYHRTSPDGRSPAGYLPLCLSMGGSWARSGARAASDRAIHGARR